MQSTISFIVGNIGGKKTRERFETILEPLQAILQIACLSFFPIGSKLAIHNNILVIQGPGYTQQVKRWYNNDKKEDVFYLYNVFSRFNKFYKNVLVTTTGGASAGTVQVGTVNSQLFSLLNELAKIGINNLIRTYNQTDKIHILHTLQMYKGMLDNPELVRRLGSSSSSSSSSSATPSSNEYNNDDGGGDDEPALPRQFPLPSKYNTVHTDGIIESSNIDTIFTKITELYSQDDFNLIYHTLMKIQNDTQYYMNYIEGLNKIMEPVNIRIKKWIDDNIVF
jgi:hypothetical protein